ncbi:MAG TPA: polysaccharide deacetylase family protein [Longimicrobium sp.]|nr:polysaccharide deacetylase family protein [Longimicrobium sp.]
MVGMTNKLTVVMYHYVRDVEGSPYPGLKALGTRQFSDQLDYLQKNYEMVSMEAVLGALDDGTALPPKAALLTFDDGYVEHYEYVFPQLVRRGIQGCFFPPAEAITQHKVLDVNKTHFVLACSPDIDCLLREIFDLLGRFREEFELPSDEFYFRKLAVANRLDCKEVAFVKRLLQHELPELVCTAILTELLANRVGEGEAAFSKQLYMSETQLREMRARGMYIGSHGHRHRWLGLLPEQEQEQEILKGREFINRIGESVDSWTMSYPYGSYNDSLVKLAARQGCQLAFTTDAAVADLSTGNRFTLPRLDTNDLLCGNPERENWWRQG